MFAGYLVFHNNWMPYLLKVECWLGFQYQFELSTRLSIFLG
jgi:hypothetical protein